MPIVNDNWGRLVAATLNRQELREIALYAESFSSAASDSDFDSFRRDLPDSEILSSHHPTHFPFNELRKATRNFLPGNLIAEGEFTLIFKGIIEEHTFGSGSQSAIAVKKLKHETFHDNEEWLAEVKNLGQLHHPNLVKLLGYCFDDVHRLLVYEFMPKGSLRYQLITRARQTLPWDARISVATGVAKGLSFLHERNLVHGDVKSSSILLDVDFSAMLCGFLPFHPQPVGNWTKRSGYWSPPHGYRPPSPGGSPPPPPLTRSGYRPNGYQAPEYSDTGELTVEGDVYSFGVVLLELLCGRCAHDPRQFDLVKFAQPYLSSRRKIPHIIDAKLEGQFPIKGAYSVSTLAGKCIKSFPKDRPAMSVVLDALEKLQGPKAGTKNLVVKE